MFFRIFSLLFTVVKGASYGLHFYFIVMVLFFPSDIHLRSHTPNQSPSSSLFSSSVSMCIRKCMCSRHQWFKLISSVPLNFHLYLNSIRNRQCSGESLLHFWSFFSIIFLDRMQFFPPSLPLHLANPGYPLSCLLRAPPL